MDFVSDCIQTFFTALNGFEMDEMQVEKRELRRPKCKTQAISETVKVLQGEDFLYANDPGHFELLHSGNSVDPGQISEVREL